MPPSARRLRWAVWFGIIDGRAQAQIAAKLNTPRETVRDIINAIGEKSGGGLSAKSAPPELPKRVVERIAERNRYIVQEPASGRTQADIARELGLSLSAAEKIVAECRKNRTTPESRDAPPALPAGYVQRRAKNARHRKPPKRVVERIALIIDVAKKSRTSSSMKNSANSRFVLA